MPSSPRSDAQPHVGRRSCPVCDSADHDDILSLPQLPVLINAQVDADAGGDVARGDIDLVVCLGCGHLFNRSFDETLLDYGATYENSLHFSASFRAFAARLADRLVTAHDLRGGRVAELGSGPGHFLSMLCDAGVAEAFGFDPSYDPARLGAPDHPSVSISTDRFPADGSLTVQLAFSQHVLEHLDDPVGALAAQRAAVAPTAGVVYSEVPNGRLMVDRCALWDLVYEHLSYFVPTSFAVSCRRAGLEVASTGVAFGDQFLWCDATPGPVDPDARPAAAEVRVEVAAAHRFGRAATRRIEEAREELVGWADRGPVIVWGAGSKGATYLNLVANVAAIAGVVDINPRKFGCGVPGTDLVVSEPEEITRLRPRTVLAANPVYVDEITETIHRLGVDAAVRPLWS